MDFFVILCIIKQKKGAYPMRDYLFLLFSVFLTTGDFACNKLYQKKAGASLAAGLLFNAMMGLFMGLIFLIPILIKGNYVLCTPYSLAMACIATILVSAYNTIGFKIMKSGSMALYTMFLMTGGMLVPYVWGIFYLDEEFSLIRTVGLLMIIFAVFLANYEKQKTNKKQVLWCLLVFFFDGIVSIVSKSHQIEAVRPHVSAAEFVMLSGLCRFVLMGTLYLIVTKKTKSKPVKVRSVTGVVLGSAATSGLSYLLVLLGAKSIPVTVLYPLVTGGCMVIPALVGVVFFKDKLTPRVAVSVAICFAATFMFL